MIPISVISATHVEEVVSFLVTLFDVKAINVSVQTTPLRYTNIDVSEGASIVIVSKESMGQHNNALKNLVQKHIFVAVKDIKIIQQRAIQLGAHLSHSNTDDCMFVGPEKLVIQIVNMKSSVPMHEILMASTRNDDLSSTSNGALDSSASGHRHQRPTPIPTLDIQVLSHNSAKYVPLLPNAFDVIPFETEVSILMHPYCTSLTTVSLYLDV
jgi:hypothetical protein